MNTEQLERLRSGLSVTYWSIAVNLFLGLVKVVCGFIAHSRALLADGLHSLSDLSSDVAVIVGLKLAQKPRDSEHPYGHHRFSSVSQLIISLMIIGFAIALVWTSLIQFVGEEAVRGPGLLALAVAVISLLVKEGLFYWTRYVARKTNSSLLLANAWHHRTDSISSLVAAVGIAAAWAGGERWSFLDPLLGAALGGYLGLEGGRMLLKSLNDLLDRAPDADVINDLREHILPTPGVIAYHDFRSRRVGDMIEVDLHVQVDPEISVDDGHEIARAVRENILKRHPEVLDVLVHIEPANREHLKKQGVFGFSDD